LDPGRLGGVALTPALAGKVNGALGLPATAGVAAALQFRDRAAATAQRAAAVAGIPADPPLPELGVDAVAAGVLGRLDPAITVGGRINVRVRIPDRVRPRPGRDALEEILAAPVFPQP